MKSVIMTKTTLGAEDGFTVKEYKQDEQYEMVESLANTFLRDGVAFAVEELGIPEAPAQTSEDDAPGDTSGESVAGSEEEPVGSTPEGEEEAPAQNKRKR